MAVADNGCDVELETRKKTTDTTKTMRIELLNPVFLDLLFWRHVYPDLVARSTARQRYRNPPRPSPALFEHPFHLSPMTTFGKSLGIPGGTMYPVRLNSPEEFALIPFK